MRRFDVVKRVLDAVGAIRGIVGPDSRGHPVEQPEGAAPLPSVDPARRAAAGAHVQFSLGALFLLIALAAVFICVHSFHYHRLRTLCPSLLDTYSTSAMLWATVSGGTLSAMAVMGMAAVLRSDVSWLRSQPGHWILLVSGAGAILDGACGLCVGIWCDGHLSRLETAGAVSLVFSGIACAVGFLCAAALVRAHRSWRAFFGFQSAWGLWIACSGSLLLLGYGGYDMTPSWPFVVSAALYGLAVWHDVRRPQGAQQLHWLGVAYLGAGFVVNLVPFVATHLL
jgi:hypothetical protein